MDRKKRKVAMVKGALVADALALGGHWIYNMERLEKEYGEYDRFYPPHPKTFHTTKKIGEHTHYGDQVVGMLEFLNGKEYDENEYKKYFIDRMSKYTGYMDHATEDSLKAYEEGSKYGSNSSDIAGICRMPAIVYNEDNKEEGIKKIISQTKISHNNKEVLLTGEFFGKVIYKVLDGSKPSDAIEAVRVEMGNSWISTTIGIVKKNLPLCYTNVVKEMGQGCSVEGAFPSTLYFILNYEEDYKTALSRNILAGGDSAARGILIGMILGAYKEEGIPSEWIESTLSLKEITGILG